MCVVVVSYQEYSHKGSVRYRKLRPLATSSTAARPPMSRVALPEAGVTDAGDEAAHEVKRRRAIRGARAVLVLDATSVSLGLSARARCHPVTATPIPIAPPLATGAPLLRDLARRHRP